MILVLFFLSFIILIAIFILGMIFSKLEINVKNITINTFEKIFEIKIEVVIYFLKLFKIAKIKIDNQKIAVNGMQISKTLTIKNGNKKIVKLIIYKILQERIRNITGKEFAIFENELLNNIKIKSIKPNIKKLNIDIQIGTEDVILTSFLVFVSSIIMNIFYWNLLNKKKYRNYRYLVRPNYCNVNQFKTEINSKIDFNMIHILKLLEIYVKLKKNFEIDD